MRTSRRGHTLPELLVTSAIVLLLIGLVASILVISVRSSQRVDTGVDLQLQAHSWLDRLASDLAGCARHRFFADRCELDVFQCRELVRFDPSSGYDAATRTAELQVAFSLGTPEKGWETPLAAFNFDRSEVLQIAPTGGRGLRLRFPTAPSTGDRILLEYPVNHLVVWWREPETGLVRREQRDSTGGTSVEVLNPAGRRPQILCQGLTFEEPLPRVARIGISVTGEQGAHWQDSLDVSLGN